VADPPALPAFVVAEVEAFLRCGILAHGLVLARCRDCGWSRAVAFSCQRRGFCPSCIGRRMCDFAARLVTDVVPHVPVRQWVLTVPHNLRARLAIDPALTTLVLGEFIAAVTTWLRRRARRLGIRGEIKTGAVTVIQRFNSALDVAPHFHSLFLDGAYTFPPGRKRVFHSPPVANGRRHCLGCGRRVPPSRTPSSGARARRRTERLRGKRTAAGGCHGGFGTRGDRDWPSPGLPRASRARLCCRRRCLRDGASMRTSRGLQPPGGHQDRRQRSRAARAHGPVPRTASRRDG
jgi:Transposase zinc-binding domain/Putative transposase